MNTTSPAPKTLVEAIRYFSDPHIAHTFFASIRWPEGTVCPRCGSKDVRYLAKYRRFQCARNHAKRQFTVKTGTVMEDSPVSLDKWAVAFWLEANAKNSISSYEVHRALGVTQKTAWFMQQRIRLAMQDGSLSKMGGNGSIIEADETFIGGLARNMHKGKRKYPGTGHAGKEVVMGLLERGGKGQSKVRAKHVSSTSKKNLQREIRANVHAGSELHTDQLASYQGLDSEYVHKVIDHAVAYVQGNVHTNGLENFWALFKRCIKGTHVSVEPFHLFRYLDSEAFRFNNRTAKDGERFVRALAGLSGKRLSYKALTGKLEPYTRSDSNGGNASLLN